MYYYLNLIVLNSVNNSTIRKKIKKTINISNVL